MTGVYAGVSTSRWKPVPTEIRAAQGMQQPKLRAAQGMQQLHSSGVALG